MKGKAVGIINDKGGVTKSTSTICLATHLMGLGHSVAIVDTDARLTCLEWAEAANHAGLETPFMIGNNKDNVGNEISKLKTLHDFVIIDGMSSFVNFERKDKIASIIKACDFIFVPTEPNAFDLWALHTLADIVKQRQEITDDGTPKAYLYGARVRANTNEWAEFLEHKDESPFPVLDVFLPLYVEFPRTTGEGKTPLSLPSDNKAHIAVKAWAESLENIINA